MKKIFLFIIATLLCGTFAKAQTLLATIAEDTSTPGCAWKLTVNVTGISSYSAITFDMALPDGVKIGKATKGLTLGSTHSIEAELLSTTKMRVVIYSSNSSSFTRDSGILFTLTLTGTNLTKGDYDLTLSGITFVDSTGKETSIANTSTTLTSTYVKYYTITYMLEGSVFATQKYAYGETVTPYDNPPAREGYTFSGWKGVPSTMPAKDVSVTGRYSVNYYNLKFLVDGEILSQNSVAYGATITAPSVEVPADNADFTYKWSGWNATVPATMPAKDLTFTSTIIKTPVIPDGITTTTLTNTDANIYDMSGRKVRNTTRGGIYIVNGKKYIK